MPENEPRIETVLLADESDESQEARRLLTKAGISFREVPASGADIPAVRLRNLDDPTFPSSIYSSLEGVRLIARRDLGEDDFNPA